MLICCIWELLLARLLWKFWKAVLCESVFEMVRLPLLLIVCAYFCPWPCMAELVLLVLLTVFRSIMMLLEELLPCPWLAL